MGGRYPGYDPRTVGKRELTYKAGNYLKDYLAFRHRIRLDIFRKISTIVNALQILNAHLERASSGASNTVAPEFYHVAVEL